VRAHANHAAYVARSTNSRELRASRSRSSSSLVWGNSSDGRASSIGSVTSCIPFEALADDPRIDASDIQVDVRDGEVALRGQVLTREMRRGPMMWRWTSPAFVT
jgi:osmotically-inducible protein OsmY